MVNNCTCVKQDNSESDQVDTSRTPIAQLVEGLTLNRRVTGSNLAWSAVLCP